MNNKIKKTIIVIVIVLLLVIGAIVAINSFKHFEEKKYSGTAGQNVSQASDNVVYYNGQKYEYNYNLKNILFMGVDREAEIEVQKVPGKGGQADCIMILSIDKETKTSQILQISRDSMTDVDIYDTQGSYYTTINAQLATQFAYGNGVKTSCWATKRTVGELLYDVPIYGYIALDIAGIPMMNDYVGGVTLTIPEDYTDINKSFVKGEKITLNGEQAEQYIRYRDVDKKGSNNERMERQVQYIPALSEAFNKYVGDSEEAWEELDSMLSPYIVSDLTTEDLEELIDYEWTAENVTYVPGKVVTGEKNEEFHVNEEKLQEIIIDMFYKLKE